MGKVESIALQLLVGRTANVQLGYVIPGHRKHQTNFIVNARSAAMGSACPFPIAMVVDGCSYTPVSIPGFSSFGINRASLERGLQKFVMISSLALGGILLTAKQRYGRSGYPVLHYLILPRLEVRT
jgi:hypothetical protein